MNKPSVRKYFFASVHFGEPLAIGFFRLMYDLVSSYPDAVFYLNHSHYSLLCSN
ncbi:MAG: hypothetical protein JWQ54_3812 [Mucilaginibacter sp.]|nr:hypothetical protein [Mucilaginibacter sp.]